jgi:hypothetical protein
MASSVTIHGAGEKAPSGGEYRVVNRHGHYLGRKVTCAEGHRLPPTEAQYEAGWVFHDTEATDGH